MKKYVILVIFLLLLAILLFWMFGKKKGSSTEMNEEDRRALVEDSATATTSQPHDSVVFPNTALGNQLKDHMMILSMPAETIEEADAKYNASITELKKNATEAIVLLNDAYNKTEAKHYFNRWGIVKTMGELENPSAVKPLADIAFSKIGPEESKDLHHFSSQEEEAVIRIRAIEGLGLLAKQGDAYADRTLLQIALDSTISNSAMRLRAIKAYLRSGKNTDERAKLLSSRLDKSWQDVITTSVTSPEEFIKKMDSITKLSDEKTKDSKTERPASATPSPKAKGN